MTTILFHSILRRNLTPVDTDLTITTYMCTCVHVDTDLTITFHYTHSLSAGAQPSSSSQSFYLQANEEDGKKGNSILRHYLDMFFRWWDSSVSRLRGISVKLFIFSQYKVSKIVQLLNLKYFRFITFIRLYILQSLN